MATTTAARQYATVTALLDLARTHGASGQHAFDVVRRAIHTSENRSRATGHLTPQASDDYALSRAALRQIEREQCPERHSCPTCGTVVDDQTPAERLAGLRACLAAATLRPSASG